MQLLAGGTQLVELARVAFSLPLRGAGNILQIDIVEF